MAPLPDRYDSSLRIAAPMRLIGIRFLLGVILLVTTLFRRTALGWVCTGPTAEACGNLAGFASGSVLVLNLEELRASRERGIYRRRSRKDTPLLCSRDHAVCKLARFG